MQKFAKFVSLNYIPGCEPSIIQESKGGRTPRNAISGGNG